MSTATGAPVLGPESLSERTPPRARRDWPNPVTLIVAAALACSPLAFGFYDFTLWAPLGLGAAVLLVMLVLGPSGRLHASARTAAGGMALLVVLSFASIAWAESRDSAWRSANQIAVYAVIFAIGLIAIRRRTTAWATLTLLGLPALVTAIMLTSEFIAGDGGGAFLNGRLNAPIGYVNGTAAMLVMGTWPWLGLAERRSSGWWRAAANAAAALTASAAVLTQTRAIVLAAVASIALALWRAEGRRRRATNLLIVLAALAAGAHWTLHVYGSTGPTHLPEPDAAALRGAGLALLGAALLAFLGTLASHNRWSRVPSMRPRRGSRRLSLTVLAVLVLGLTAAALIERGSIQRQWHDFTTLNDERSVNDRFVALGGGPRYDLWRIALDEFAGDPVGGVGAGNYPDQEFRRRRALEHVTTPHSLEFQMLAELGVGGAVGLLLLVLPVFGAGLTRRTSSLTGRDAALSTAALGMFGAWFACSSVDWIYDIPGLTGMAMLAAAVLLAPAASSAAAVPRPRSPSPLRSRLTVGLVLATLALVAASLGRQYVATLYSDSGQALAQAHPLQALGELRPAEQLDPWSLQTQYAIASAYARANDYADARTTLLRAQRLEPENYVPPALLGDIALRAGEPRVALEQYRRALLLDPLEPSLRRAITALELRHRPRSSGLLPAGAA